MLDKEINKERVDKWRAKKFQKGYKSLTVYLPPETLKMVQYLRGLYYTKKCTTKLISTAIERMYKVAHAKRSNDD